MKKHLKISIFTFLLASVAIVSCDDKWNEHYNNEEYKNGQTVIEYLKSNDDLSLFVEILEKTGYADTLNTTQAFTVFAPPNESLKNIDMTDMDMLKKLASNHITKSTYSASAGSQQLLLMVNKKYLLFASNTIAGKSIKTPNIRTKNGVVHILNEYIPYVNNIWEFIQYENGLDSLKTYINSLTKLVFDEKASFDANNVFIDSVFREQNNVIDLLGTIDDENYYYTAILPTNTAWNDTYNKIFPFYRSTDKKTGNVVVQDGASLQVDRTKWAVIQDFIFQGLIVVPTGLDTLASTNHNVFHQPDYLFEGITPQIASNGLCYVTDVLRNKIDESWAKKIKVETELNPYGLVVAKNSKSQGRYRNNLASNGYYIRLEDLSTSSLDKISISFPIPNTLAGLKYNIYCAMVPASFTNPSDTMGYKVDFYLSYIRENGVLSESKVSTTSPLLVNIKQITKVPVAQNFVFPYCNLLERGSTNYANEIKVFLRIENAATPTEERQGKFSRSLAFDYIILEPVIE